MNSKYEGKTFFRSLTLNQMIEYYERRNLDKDTPIKIGHEALREYDPRLSTSYTTEVHDMTMLPNTDPKEVCVLLIIKDDIIENRIRRNIEFDDDIPF